MEKLEDDLRELRSEMQKATLDYLDMYAKAKKLFGRAAKAAARAEEQQEEGTLMSSQEPGGVPLSSLSPRARLIQQQILARRANMANNRG